MARNIAEIHARVRREFDRLKAISDPDTLARESIAFADGTAALAPVCQLHVADDDLLDQMGRWRQNNMQYFATRFPITVEGTRMWVRDYVLATPDRMLFLVIERPNRPIGYMGFARGFHKAGAMEQVNNLRGEKSSISRPMFRAHVAIGRWAERMFRPRGFFAHVLGDNERGIEFHLGLGMNRGRTIPLRKKQNGDFIALVPCDPNDTAPPDNTFVRMTKFSFSNPATYAS